MSIYFNISKLREPISEQIHPKKIILISEFCDGNINSTGLYWEKIAEYLSMNSSIYIISTNINYRKLTNIDKNKYKLKNNKFLKFLLKHKIFVFTYICFQILRSPIKNSVILIGTNPYLMPLGIILIKLLQPSKVVLLSYDLFPDNLNVQTKSIFIKLIVIFLSYLYAFIYKLTDQIIVCGYDMRTYLVTKYEIDPKKIFYVPNWGDKKSIANKNEGYLIDKKLNLLFFGNLGIFQAIPHLITQIDNSDHHNFNFIFAGSGKYAKEIKLLESRDSRVKYLGAILMNERKEVFNLANISLISLVEGMKGLCVPSRFYFAISNGHPVLAFVEKGSEIDLICNKYNCGWTLDIRNKNSLSEFLNNFSYDDYVNKLKAVKNFPFDILSGKKSLEMISKILC